MTRTGIDWSQMNGWDALALVVGSIIGRALSDWVVIPLVDMLLAAIFGAAK